MTTGAFIAKKALERLGPGWSASSIKRRIRSGELPGYDNGTTWFIETLRNHFADEARRRGAKNLDAVAYASGIIQTITAERVHEPVARRVAVPYGMHVADLNERTWFGDGSRFDDVKAIDPLPDDLISMTPLLPLEWRSFGRGNTVYRPIIQWSQMQEYVRARVAAGYLESGPEGRHLWAIVKA